MSALWSLAPLAALVAVALVALRWMARRVVAVRRPRRTLEAHGSVAGTSVTLSATPLTTAAGEYGLWFGDKHERHARIGHVLDSDDRMVRRAVLRSSAELPEGSFSAQWTGHTQPSPAATGLPYRDVSVPLRDGSAAPAWLFSDPAGGGRWTIHVQGIRTSRLVTLRSAVAAVEAGSSALVVTYRGAGDGPAAGSCSTLGQREWQDIADAVKYARTQGATDVCVVGWSMGAGVALEAARLEPGIDSLILICPATNWTPIVRHAASKAHLPQFAATALLWTLSNPLMSRFVGLAEPLDFDRLDWTRAGAVSIPTLVLHSMGDDEIPGELSRAFAAAHPDHVQLLELADAPHGFEGNVAPAAFSAAINGWLARQHT